MSVCACACVCICVCVCVCVCVYVLCEAWGEGVREACPLRVFVILFYAFIYFNYGLCPVYLFCECDKLDVLLHAFFIFD